uniref:Uncharacterized protein n=1 Tax=uncultured marine virus TaxID=186617 RepID=A0A0F7LA06_9VIRU|nr:hypothetical protein [uncultured marine virus]
MVKFLLAISCALPVRKEVSLLVVGCVIVCCLPRLYVSQLKHFVLPSVLTPRASLDPHFEHC